MTDKKVRETVQEMYALHAQLCKAIADPKRLLIIDALRNGERSVGDIADELGFSQPNTSQHLAILRSRNVVTTSRAGRHRHRPLRRGGLRRSGLHTADAATLGLPN